MRSSKSSQCTRSSHGILEGCWDVQRWLVSLSEVFRKWLSRRAPCYRRTLTRCLVDEDVGQVRLDVVVGLQARWSSTLIVEEEGLMMVFVLEKSRSKSSWMQNNILWMDRRVCRCRKEKEEQYPGTRIYMEAWDIASEALAAGVTRQWLLDIFNEEKWARAEMCEALTVSEALTCLGVSPM